MTMHAHHGSIFGPIIPSNAYIQQLINAFLAPHSPASQIKEAQVNPSSKIKLSGLSSCRVVSFRF